MRHFIFIILIAVSPYAMGDTCTGSAGVMSGLAAFNEVATPSSVTLAWNHTSTGIGWSGWSYQLFYKLSTSSTYTDSGVTTGGHSGTINGLTPGARYDFHVVGKRTCGLDGSTQTQQTGAFLDGVLFKPAPPTTFAPTNVGSTTYTASWQANGLCDSFLIDLASNPAFSPMEVSNFNMGTGTSIPFVGLIPGVTFYFRVRAGNSAGTSLNSAVSSATLLPITPSNVVASNAAETSFMLSWAPSAGANSYRVDVGSDNTFADNTWYEDLVVSSTSQLITGLPSASRFYFRVRAVGPGGTTQNSATGSIATTPQPPVLTGASAITANSFTVNWNPPSGAMYYQLDVAKDKSFNSFVPGFKNHQVMSGTSVQVGNLDAGQYFYRVRAVNNNDAPSINSMVAQASIAGGGLNSNTPFSVNVIPPSPEASALAKYADVPVSLYSGTPNISIPLYEIKERELKLPVSLNYHASGNKVETTATRTGLGWSLDAGGVVTRAIRGRPDEYGRGGFLNTANLYHSAEAFTAGTDDEKYQRYNDVVEGCVEAEPDLFYFNFGSYSGTFMFNWSGQIEILSGNKIQIQPLGLPAPGTRAFIDGWKIIVDDGTVFTFSQKETVRTQVINPGPSPACQIAEQQDIDNLPSAWYLTEMRTANQVSWIRFEYEPYTLVTLTPEPETKWYDVLPISDESGHIVFDWEFYIALPKDIDAWRQLAQVKTTYSGSNLKKITTSSGQTIVELLPWGQPRTDLPALNTTSNFPLGAVNVKNINSRQIIRWDFFYSYATGRLTLESATESSGTIVKPSYKFSYYPGTLPASTSYAQDHWGFLNGNTTNTLVPALTVLPLYIRAGYSHHVVNVPWNGPKLKLGDAPPADNPITADRSPNPTTILYGMLKQITYPTGGVDLFEFEPHDYSFEQDHELIKEVTVNKQAVVAVPPGNSIYNTSTDLKDQVSFTLPKTTEVTFDAEYKFQTRHNKALFSPRYTILDGNGAVLYTEERSAPSDGTGDGTASTRYFTLAPGTYTIAVKVRRPIDAVSSVKVTARWTEGTGQMITETRSGGGLRIARVTRSFGNGNPSRVTNYSYKLSQDASKSSGSLLEASYVYGVFSQHFTPVTDFFSNLDTVFYSVSQNRSALGTTQGSHVGYRNVTVTNQGGETGKSEYHFTSPWDAPDVPSTEVPFPPAFSLEYKRGLLLDQTDYNASGQPVKKVANTYLNYSTVVPAVKIGWRVPGGGPIGPGLLGRYAIANYSAQLGYNRLNETRETVFDSGISFETVTTFIFDETTHKQLISTSSINSKGETMVSAQKYPLDYTSPSGTITLMKTMNMHNVPIEQLVWKNGTGAQVNLLSAIRTDFANNNGKIFATAKAGAKITTPISTTDPYGTAKNNYEGRIVFTAYDGFNNLKEHAMPNGFKTSYQWNYAGTLPTAKVENAASNQIFFESFEEITTASTSQQRTGRKSNPIAGTYSIPTANRPAVNGNYILSYWVMEGSNAWTYHEKAIQNYVTGTAIVSDAHTGFIDDVRIYPVGALMITYTYEPLVGITSITDPTNVTVYYDYDDMGRLKSVRDFDGNILEGYDYQFHVQAPYDQDH